MSNLKNKLKIIYLINELGKGGSERQLYLLLKHMDLQLAEPLVIVFNPSALTDYAQPIRALGISVIAMPVTVRSVLARLFWLFRLFRQHKPDVVHSWSAPDNPYAGFAGWLAHVPLRMGSLRNSLSNRSFRTIHPLVQKLTVRACPHLLVNAESIRQELLASQFSPCRIFLLDNCVEFPPTLNNVNLPEPLSGAVRLIGTVGNIRRNKNIHIFVEGIANLTDRFPDLRGVIVGQPIPDELDYFNRVQEMIVNKGLSDRVFLLGFRDDAPQLVSKFDVFCLLSESEGSPNAILEAMAAGRPIIASNTSGIPDLVEQGINGLLVPPGDPLAFAQALEKMLSNPQLEDMGAQGRKRVESRYSCQQKSAQLLQLYQQLLGRNA